MTEPRRLKDDDGIAAGLLRSAEDDAAPEGTRRAIALAIGLAPVAPPVGPAAHGPGAPTTTAATKTTATTAAKTTATTAAKTTATTTAKATVAKLGAGIVAKSVVAVAVATGVGVGVRTAVAPPPLSIAKVASVSRSSVRQAMPGPDRMAALPGSRPEVAPAPVAVPVAPPAEPASASPPTPAPSSASRPAPPPTSLAPAPSSASSAQPAPPPTSLAPAPSSASSAQPAPPPNSLAPAPSASAPPSPPAPAPSPPSTLTDEVTRIDRALAALRDHQPARALALLDDYDRHYPSGAMAPEAAIARIEATLALGDGARVRELGTQFLAAHPTSPLAPRVRELMSRAP